MALMDEIENDPFLKQLFLKLVKIVALDCQEKAPDMSAEEIFENEDFFPAWNPDMHNYKDKKAGYVCKSPKGNLVRLIQPYDSDIYPAEPEELAAQWGFYWSKDPKRAKAFVKSATSPYGIGDCCIENGVVYRSTMASNTFAPSEYSRGWKEVPEEELLV